MLPRRCRAASTLLVSAQCMLARGQCTMHWPSPCSKARRTSHSQASRLPQCNVQTRLCRVQIHMSGLHALQRCRIGTPAARAASERWASFAANSSAGALHAAPPRDMLSNAACSAGHRLVLVVVQVNAAPQLRQSVFQTLGLAADRRLRQLHGTLVRLLQMPLVRLLYVLRTLPHLGDGARQVRTRQDEVNISRSSCWTVALEISNRIKRMSRHWRHTRRRLHSSSADRRAA